MQSYQITVFQYHELFCAHVFRYILVVGCDAFAVYSALWQNSVPHLSVILKSTLTSAVHLAVAVANFSMGLVRPGIVVVVSEHSHIVASYTKCPRARMGPAEVARGKCRAVASQPSAKDQQRALGAVALHVSLESRFAPTCTRLDTKCHCSTAAHIRHAIAVRGI